MSATRHEVTFSDYGREEYGLFLKAKGVPEFELMLEEGSRIVRGLSVPMRFAHMLGCEATVMERGWAELPPFLFRDQAEIVKLALAAERFACWSDCGLGKTLIELEFARQVALATGGRVLILTVNGVVEEIVEQARVFYGESLRVRVLESRAEMREWCARSTSSGPLAGGGEVAITNYEKMNPEGGPETQVVREMALLAGLVLDESSRLKTGGGKQKWAIIKSSKGIRYKLSCTATPAPNEVMEFASQASFLERIRGEEEVMWTYFTRDPVTQEWTVKAHARPHFFRWMASWSIYLRDPEAYGWGRGVAPVPEPVFLQHRIAATAEQLAMAAVVEAEERGQMANGKVKMEKKTRSRAGELSLAEVEGVSLGMVGRNVLSQVAKGFRYEAEAVDGVRRIESNKPGFIAELIRREARMGLQVLVWCVFDAEVDVLMEALARIGVPAVSLGGRDKKAERPGILEEFRSGRVQVLVGKAQMLGFGYNFQFCGSMVFSGFNDSFEAFYQAVRRAYRFGQLRRLRVHLPFVPELEEAILRNVLRKAEQFEALIREQELAYVAARSEIAGKEVREEAA